MKKKIIIISIIILILVVSLLIFFKVNSNKNQTAEEYNTVETNIINTEEAYSKQQAEFIINTEENNVAQIESEDRNSGGIYVDDEEMSNILEYVQEMLKTGDYQSSNGLQTDNSSERRNTIETDIADIQSIIDDLESNPENYISIDGITISIDMDLTVMSGLSKEDFKTLIGNCKYDTTKFFYENSDLIYDVCQKFQINEIFFVGLIAGESAWDVREAHRVKHNYVSIKGASDTMYTFNSIEEGMVAAASLLHNQYLVPERKLL